jgi:hypothetical protein
MNRTPNLISLLKEHQHKLWTPARPSNKEDIVKVEKKLNVQFPEDYKQFLLYSEGGELENDDTFIDFYDLYYLDELNPHPVWSLGLPEMIFFASDQGDYICYFDPNNRLCKGHWYIYGVEMGMSNFDYSIPLAENIYDLFQRVFNGEDIFSGSYLKNR